MERLTANIALAAAKRATLNGREHIVAPLTMIVPGVLNGSRGPLLYPADEIAKNAGAWNHMPIVLRHPTDASGNPISARQPSVLNESAMGVVLNARVADGKLQAEGWFDVERLREVAPQVLNALEAGQAIELSTGLMLDAEPATGVHNGREYKAIARNYQPDHLAILPGEKGACSLEDGCGVLVNEDKEKSLLEKFKSLIGGLTRNELSLFDREEALRREVAKKFGDKAWIVDVFDSYVIVEQEGKFLKVGYMKGDDSVELGSETQEVVKEVKYVPVTNKDQSMGKKELVDAIIANCDCWSEEDRETLNSFDDKKLEAMKRHLDEHKQLVSVANSLKKGIEGDNVLVKYDGEKLVVENKKHDGNRVDEKELVANEANKNDKPKPKTAEQWLAEAPPEIQSAVQNAMAIERREKEQIVDQLTANVEDKDALREMLLKKPLDELRALQALAPKREPQRTVNYFGAATPPSPQQSNAAKEEALPLPVMNYSDDN